MDSDDHVEDAYDASDDGEVEVPEGLEAELFAQQLQVLHDAGWPEGVQI